MEHVVQDAATLAALRQPSVKSTIRRIRIDSQLADQHIEQKLNRAYFACGCEEGSLAVLATLAGSMVLGMLLGFNGPLTLWLIGAYVLGAALLGKLAGLAYYRLQLTRIYRRLLASATAANSPTAQRSDALHDRQAQSPWA